MRSKAIFWIIILVVAVVFIGLAFYLYEPAQQKDSFEVIKEDKASNTASKEEISGVIAKDEPEARALYEKMNETFRKAQTLSYKSIHRDVYGGEEYGHSTYTIWMKKPNFFYVEAINLDNNSKGILVGDGQYAWNFWPKGRPSFRGEDYEVYEKSRFNVYMKEPAPPGKYSIGYAVVFKKSNCFPILDPSVFQGIKDTIEPYIDFIRSIGAEKVGNEECDVIEVSYMKHQRSHYFWISKKDNLPRKLKMIIPGSKESVTYEIWSEVTLNDEIATEKFAWTPPENWRQWHPPSPEDKLLKPGQNAPDFELYAADGGKIKLSGYRGKIVWLYIWRSG